MYRYVPLYICSLCNVHWGWKCSVKSLFHRLHHASHFLFTIFKCTFIFYFHFFKRLCIYMYGVQFLFYTVLCAVFVLHCTLYSFCFTLYGVQFLFYTVECTVFVLHCRVYSFRSLATASYIVIWNNYSFQLFYKLKILMSVQISANIESEKVHKLDINYNKCVNLENQSS